MLNLKIDMAEFETIRLALKVLFRLSSVATLKQIAITAGINMKPICVKRRVRRVKVRD